MSYHNVGIQILHMENCAVFINKRVGIEYPAYSACIWGQNALYIETYYSNKERGSCNPVTAEVCSLGVGDLAKISGQ